MEEETRKKELNDYMLKNQELRKENEKKEEIQRKQEFKELSLLYREKNLEKRIKKQLIHKDICSEIMKFVLDLSDVTILFKF